MLFTWAITTVCLAGTILNGKKNILCFYLWTFGNLAWLVFDLQSRLYSRAVLDVVQLGFSVWGIFEWRKK